MLWKPIEPAHVEILHDLAFQRSVAEVSGLTLLDSPRLANLWMLARMSNPAGAIVELGVYKGGSALHLANACPGRKIFICDTFDGFGDISIDPTTEAIFNRNQFRDTSAEKITSLFQAKDANFKVLHGVFPQSDKANELQNISFVHVDFDLYESVIASLDYLKDRLTSHSIIVLDDVFRQAGGLMKALAEFLNRHSDFMVFPMFPSQGLLLHRSWFDCTSNPLRTWLFFHSHYGRESELQSATKAAPVMEDVRLAVA